MSDVPEEFRYLFESTTWSLGGLVLGYALGRMERKIDEVDVEVQQVAQKLDQDS